MRIEERFLNVGENDTNSLLIVSMVENVKGKGGSHYLLPKVKEILLLLKVTIILMQLL